jgi:two-component system response regulator NreC
MPSSKKIKILIADDHHLVRAGIVALLSRQDDMDVVAEASNGVEAVEQARKFTPDIALLDISMPVMDGIKAAAEILKAVPATRVLMLTQNEEEEYLKRMLHSGVSGYILKSSMLEDLTRAIHTVKAGKRFVAPSLSTAMADVYFQGNGSPSPPPQNIHRLTNREQEILQLVAMGWANQQIANKLFISVRTVEFHRTNIMEKLSIHDTASLVKYAILNKLVDLSS